MQVTQGRELLNEIFIGAEDEEISADYEDI